MDKLQDTKAKCCHIKNWPVKVLCGRCLSGDTVSHVAIFDPALLSVAPLSFSLVQLSPLLPFPVWISILYTRIQCISETIPHSIHFLSPQENFTKCNVAKKSWPFTCSWENINILFIRKTILYKKACLKCNSNWVIHLFHKYLFHFYLFPFTILL